MLTSYIIIMYMQWREHNNVTLPVEISNVCVCVPLAHILPVDR